MPVCIRNESHKHCLQLSGLYIGAFSRGLTKAENTMLQACDDSTRLDVQRRIDAKVAEMQDRGFNCLVTRRPVNKGFKAGNMINGMEYLDTVRVKSHLHRQSFHHYGVHTGLCAALQSVAALGLGRPCSDYYDLLPCMCHLQAVQLPYEFVAIFDADFEMPPDFLFQTIWHLQCDARLAFVQTRWTFTNGFDNLLCWMQQSALSYHYAVEQRARSHLRTFFGFNGTAGVKLQAAHCISSGCMYVQRPTWLGMAGSAFTLLKLIYLRLAI